MLALVVAASCTSKKTEGNVADNAAGGQMEVEAEAAGPFASGRQLTYPGSTVSFQVKVQDKTLYIVPSGLAVSNDTLSHDLTGYTVVNAEVGDLNADSYPEVFVYLTSDGSGSYGKLIGYSVNNGKSVSQVYLPEVAGNKEVAEGYRGHDEMAIVENTFCRRFPVYKEGDSNVKPTGGIRQIQYRLVDGEAGRILKVEKVTDL